MPIASPMNTTTPTLIAEEFHLVACVQLFKRNVKVKVTAYNYSDTLLLLRRLDYVTRFNSKTMPMIDNDYSCHITAVELD